MDLFSLFLRDFVLFVILCVCVLAGLLVGVFVIRDFRRELRYINREIQRATGREKEHWKKARRKLWLSLLLFRKR